jgi:hypothetical protein
MYIPSCYGQSRELHAVQTILNPDIAIISPFPQVEAGFRKTTEGEQALYWLPGPEDAK